MLEQELKKHFGFDTFLQGQQEVITQIMKQNSAGAIFPTGAGKSLCYQLPAVLLPHLTVVVSPLLALMKDQIDFLHIHNIPAERLDSTLDREKYVQVLEKATQGELKILMISVERFKNERFRYYLQRMKICLMVVDEAHCISEWGHNFRPDYLKLPQYQQEFKIPQILLLTATATQQVIEDMCKKFSIKPQNIFSTGFYRKNLLLKIEPQINSKRDSYLLKKLKESPRDSTIVYVTLQKTAEEVAEFLSSNRINALPYHAGMKNEEREELQNQFMNGDIDCIVATIAFGMGLDKKDIRRVIHYDLPKSIENYSQEIGRSGRDGKNSHCILIANKENVPVLENFVYGDTPELSAIIKLLYLIKDNQEEFWTTKINALSYDLNIRLLSLKTLLVYLEMMNIIKPQYTYFSEYSFKYLTEPDKIINLFHGERKKFITSLFNHCTTKKIWTYVDIENMLTHYQTERKRIISALEYFDEKKMIELQSKQAVDVYDILDKTFDPISIAEKIFKHFKQKEIAEINRIKNMIDYFQTDECLSIKLAHYFGEQMTQTSCGSCSYCKNGRILFPEPEPKKPLEEYDFQELITQFKGAIQHEYNILNISKYLCGIGSPLFFKLKIKKLPHFASLEKYSFKEVKKWVESNF